MNEISNGSKVIPKLQLKQTLVASNTVLNILNEVKMIFISLFYNVYFPYFHGESFTNKNMTWWPFWWWWHHFLLWLNILNQGLHGQKHYDIKCLFVSCIKNWAHLYLTCWRIANRIKEVRNFFNIFRHFHQWTSTNTDTFMEFIG